MIPRYFDSIALVVLVVASSAVRDGLEAQVSKQLLTAEAALSWRAINTPALTPDGRWVVYSVYDEKDTDGAFRQTLVVRATAATTEYRIANATDVEVTADSRHVVFRSREPAAAGSGRVPSANNAVISVMSLPDGAVTVVSAAKTFKLAKGSGRYLVYARESVSTTPDSLGTPLVVRDLTTGTEVSIQDVTDYVVDERGRWILYTVCSSAPARDGVYLREISSGRTRALIIGPGRYRDFTFDARGTQIAFLAAGWTREPPRGAATPRFGLYYATVEGLAATEVVRPAMFGTDSAIVTGDLTFSRNGTVLRFSVEAQLSKEPPAASRTPQPAVEIWRSNDPELLSERAAAAKNPALRRRLIAQYDVSRRKLVRVGSATQYDVSPLFGRRAFSPDGRYVLVPDRTPYTRESWGEERWDVDLVDTHTGARTRLVSGGATDSGAEPEFSPTGRYVVWFDAGGWHAHEPATKKTINLTASTSQVRFASNTQDHRNLPRAWGFSVGGWTRGDTRVLVYGQYDVWALDPSGAAAPHNITGGLGERDHLRFRLTALDTIGSEDGAIDSAQPLILKAYNVETGAEGWYRAGIDGRAGPERIIMEDVHFDAVARARDAEMFVATKETVSMFPDVWIGPSLATLTRVTNINPQQSEYHWARAELVHWRSDDGVPLKGILYTPDDFDATKQYPMVVTYYERLSHTLHYYYPPNGEGRELEINPTVYTSNGYLVFVPDLVYATGEPGASVLKSVLPGVHALIRRGFVKADRIGCVGHSWGGYETFQLVTRSRLFAACAALAGIVNLPAMYGTLYANDWSYQRHAEHDQGRMKGSLWAHREDYIESSPLFYLDRVETPLLIVSNDHDDVVPWAEGFGAFMGLRRLGKEAYLLNYTGEGHQLERPANIRDFDQRLLQFFDHYLRDSAAPEWMEGGPSLPTGTHKP